LDTRLEILRKTQNSDGGWPYYAGKRASWTEPTVYAALALGGSAAVRAWQLLQGWQLPSGAWKAAAQVEGSHWTTALGAILAAAHGKDAGQAKDWLVAAGLENAWAWRGRRTQDVAGAPEPTALAILALRKLGAPVPDPQFLLSQTLRPETCGAVLLGLQGRPEVRDLLPMATMWLAESASPMTRAWLRLGLRANGVTLAQDDSQPPSSLAIVALEALAAEGGNLSGFRWEQA
jgi:hypothetical protein